MEQNKPKGCPMSAQAALAAAKAAASLRQLRHSIHASRDRMPERGVQAHDVACAIQSATQATWRPSDESWKLSGGKDLDGDLLCAFRPS